MKQVLDCFVGKAKDFNEFKEMKKMKYKIVYISGLDRLVSEVEAESKDLALVKFYLATNGVESVESVTEVNNENSSI